jgi:hypothetical protein
MLFMLWMRSYPSCHILSLHFDVSVTTVHDEINWCIPIMWEQFHALVQWPIHACLPKSENLHLQFYIGDLTACQAEGEL